MKAAVILSGCGHRDGSEIHETVLSFLALKQNNIEYSSFAPDIPMSKVVSHLEGKELHESRNVLVESARIARGEIKPLTSLHPDHFDILWLPGGFGVALNLSDYALSGERCQVNPNLVSIVRAFYQKKKPIVAICIAPAIVAKILEGEKIKLTLGSDKSALSSLEKLGARPFSCKVDEICFDEEHNIYSAPAYMEPPNIAGIYTSLNKIGEQLCSHLKNHQKS